MNSRTVTSMAVINAHRQSAQGVLSNVFQAMTGDLPSHVAGELGYSEMYSHAYALCDLLAAEKGVDRYIVSPIVMTEIGVTAIGQWQAPNGKRNSRVIVKTLKKHGIDTDGKPFQAWMKAWTEAFQTNGVRFEIQTGWDAFNNLGSNYQVDIGSCYGTDGCWKDAPVALACNLFQDCSTFVIHLFQDASMIARCWGFVSNKDANSFVLSNGYYKSGFPHDMGLFAKAINVATGIEHKHAASTYSLEAPCYVNGDTTIVWNPTITEDAPSIHDFGVDQLCYCQECGDHSETDHGFTHAFCEPCRHNGSRVTCDRCGDRVDSDDECYCDYCGNTYCGDCFNYTHHWCEHCQESTCEEVHEVKDRYGEVTWCDSCVQSWATYCDECEAYVTDRARDQHEADHEAEKAEEEAEEACC